jgi:hypothetical protein
MKLKDHHLWKGCLSRVTPNALKVEVEVRLRNEGDKMQVERLQVQLNGDTWLAGLAPVINLNLPEEWIAVRNVRSKGTPTGSMHCFSQLLRILRLTLYSSNTL